MALMVLALMVLTQLHPQAGRVAPSPVRGAGRSRPAATMTPSSVTRPLGYGVIGQGVGQGADFLVVGGGPGVCLQGHIVRPGGRQRPCLLVGRL